MRKILFLCLWLGGAAWACGEESLTLTDGGTVVGKITKSDDNGLTLRLPGEVYAATNVAWSRFSQASLKQLTVYPRIKLFVEPFIEPDASQLPPKPEVQIKDVVRLAKPVNPSILGGIWHSGIGRFILLVLFGANLFAAYEISIVRAKPMLQVMGLAAVLPVIGPIIFLAMPLKAEAASSEAAAATGAGDATGEIPAVEEIHIVEASWRQDEKPAEAQVFSRGRFTFNKRFVETKFAGFVGVPKGDALKFTMTLKTLQAEFAVERIAQVGQADAIFETPQGQLTVAFTDIQEIKLNPKTE